MQLGSGKTIAACVIASELINAGQIDSVIIIAPRRAVVDQWIADFKNITNRSTLKITGADEEPEGYGTDFCHLECCPKFVTSVSKYL